jgi:hypothetical protein
MELHVGVSLAKIEKCYQDIIGTEISRQASNCRLVRNNHGFKAFFRSGVVIHCGLKTPKLSAKPLKVIMVLGLFLSQSLVRAASIGRASTSAAMVSSMAAAIIMTGAAATF